MSSNRKVLQEISYLMEMTKQDANHKTLSPNNNTIILYDIPEWDTSMQNWVSHKLPWCQLQIISMHESVFGFGVVFHMGPQSSSLTLVFIKSLLLLLLVCVGFTAYSHMHALPIQYHESLFVHHDKPGEDRFDGPIPSASTTEQKTESTAEPPTASTTPDGAWSNTIMNSIMFPWIEGLMAPLVSSTPHETPHTQESLSCKSKTPAI